MRRVYLSLLVFFISASVFAGGWFQDFSSEVTGKAESAATDDEWYFTGASSFFGFNSGWKTRWTYESSLKPTGSFIYLDGTFYAIGGLTEFSLVSPAFTPTANEALYYKIQEIKIFDTPANQSHKEEIYVEVATKVEGAWTWTSSTANVLAGLTGYNTSTTPITVLQESLSSYADQEIRIRFRGKINEGNFVAALYSVAIIDNTVTDLAASTAQNIISQIPQKHANQALNASVQNAGKAIAAGAATVTATTTGYTGTANVPALNPLEAAALTFATPFAPQSFGEYQLQYVLSEDAVATNNTALSNTFVIAPNTFASDKGFVEGYTGSPSADLGNKFTLTENDRIESISIAWAKVGYGTVSSEFSLVIYALDEAGVLNTTPVYISPAPLTRPDNATMPANNRSATFETYPVDVNLSAGAYIFAVRSEGNVGIGTEWGDEKGVQYAIDRTANNKLSSTIGAYLLIRVNTPFDVTLSPVAGSKKVDINEPVVIAGSVITGLAATPAITIKKGDVEVADVSASYDDGKVTITHAAFELNTTYMVTVPANTITGYAPELSWSFTTVGPLEAQAFTPANDATNVALDAVVSVSFDRAIPDGSPLTGITVATDEETPVAVSGVSATKDGTVLTIAHDPFVKGTKYKVTVPASAINEMTVDTSWVFTTIPPFGLTADPFSPANEATDVELTIANLRVYFNQAIDTESSLEGITINNTPVTATIGIGMNDSRLTISTTGVTFVENTLYTVVIPAGAIAGYDEAITWSFTSFVTLAPVAYIPESGSQGVFLGTEISIEFNKTNFFVLGYNPGEITITPTDGEPLSGVTYATTPTSKKLVISHTAPLRPNTEYTINVPDNAVPNYAGISDWTFTTESAPEITGFTPEDGAENVSVSNTVEVTFNKTIALGNIEGIEINDTAPRSVTLQSSGEGLTQNKLRLVHDAFTQATEYTVTIPAGSVVGYDRDTTWSFTTVPVLAYTTSPADNATDVALDAPLKIEFDRAPLHPLNGFADIIISGDNGEEITVTDTEWNSTTGSDTLTIGHAPFDYNVTYTVEVVATSIINRDDWSGESSIIWSFTTTDGVGLPEIKDVSGVHPTLTKGEITVVSEPGALIKITDIAGVVKATYRSAGIQLPIHLDGAAGLYLVVVENSKSTLTYKVILQK
jgi:hypothetical protein